MSKWEEKHFGALCSDISYGYTESATYEKVGPKFLRITDITPEFINWDLVPYCRISIGDFERYRLKYNDIVIARTGATSGYNKLFVKSIDAVYASYLIRFRINEEKANARYVYYYLQSSAYKGFIKNYISGAAQPGINATILSKFKITLPDLPTQERIADILSAYDDLIEANNRRIELLEQAAQDLYKEWFVRFRFPGHEKAKFENGLPEGWDRKRLGDLIAFDPTIAAKGKKRFKSIPMAALNTNNMVIDETMVTSTDKLAGSRSQNLDTLLARITPCLENGKTGLVHGLKDDEIAGGSTEFIVMRSKLLTPYFVYFLARSEVFREHAINSMNGADGRQRAKVDRLEKLWWFQPPKEFLEQFDRQVRDSVELIYLLTQQNRNLAIQRNMLLPRLMSGKLEVI